ncbi:hypothetical protein M758_UG182200 [Ceratodon purpureus]|nr:hypothetical protein M758_UG182200 [Ceratodon purpureus]
MWRTRGGMLWSFEQPRTSATQRGNAKGLTKRRVWKVPEFTACMEAPVNPFVEE